MALCMTACGDAKDKPASAKEDASSSSAAVQEEKGTTLSDEEILKKANGCAKTGYNAVAEYLADMETQGRISEATEPEAAERALKELDGNCDINGTVGIRFDEMDDNGFFNFTVQFRSADKPEIVGQYPDPAQTPEDSPAWDVNAENECSASETADTKGGNGGSFGDAIGDALTGGYISKSKLKSANGNAKTGFNAVAEYLADMEVQGKLSTATEKDAALFAARELGYNDSMGIVGVKFDGDLTESFDFHVLWRENENSGLIGRYPDPPQSPDEQIDWDAAAEMSCYETYYNDDEDFEEYENNEENEPTEEQIEALKAYLDEAQANIYDPTPEEKIANGNAKIAYNAATKYLTGRDTQVDGDEREMGTGIAIAIIRADVAEYIAELEANGELTSAKKQEAADAAAKALKDAGIGGMVGLNFIDLDSINPDFTVMWRSDKSSRLIGLYPELCPSDSLEWECDVVAYVE